MPQSDWQDNLAALLTRPSGSLNDAGADILTRLLRVGSSGTSSLETEALPAAGGAALTERLLTGAAANISSQAVSLGERLSELVRVSQAQARSVEENTAALAQQTSSRLADTVKAALNSAGGFSPLSAGPAFLPLISGLTKLFGGGRAEAAPAAVPFALPAPVRLEAGISSGGSGEIRYDADGMPRAAAPRSSAAAPQINISVQAIDSRSFLDHSEEIARAVREAMLQSHVLSDIVSEF